MRNRKQYLQASRRTRASVQNSGCQASHIIGNRCAAIDLAVEMAAVARATLFQARLFIVSQAGPDDARTAATRTALQYRPGTAWRSSRWWLCRSASWIRRLTRRITASAISRGGSFPADHGCCMCIFLLLSAEVWRRLVRALTCFARTGFVWAAYLQMAVIAVGKYVPGKIWGFVAQCRARCTGTRCHCTSQIASGVVEQIFGTWRGGNCCNRAPAVFAFPQLRQSGCSGWCSGAVSACRYRLCDLQMCRP